MSFKTIIDNATGVVTQDGGQVTLPAPTEQGQVLVANSAGAWTPYAWNPTFKNRIINGDMRVAQRGTAAVSTDGSYPVDRWHHGRNTASTISLSQSSVAPPGFTNSIFCSVTSGVTPTAAQYVTIGQYIEGNNVADLSYGTASAKSIVVSFWVRSSLTGTYCGCIENSAFDRSYVYEYQINSANTWEKKSVIIPGDTSGTWLMNSGAGLRVFFILGAGSNFQTTPNTWQSGNLVRTANQINFVGTAGATFYLTGVQLEVGSVATPFEMRPEPLELQLCQRYYQRIKARSDGVGGDFFASGVAQSASAAYMYCKYSQPMRSTPTFNGSSVFVNAVSTTRTISSFGIASFGSDSAMLIANTSGMTGGQPVCLQATNASAYIEFSAEL